MAEVNASRTSRTRPTDAAEQGITTMSFDRHGQRQPGAAPAASVTDAPSPGKRTLVQDLPATAPVQRSAAPRAEPRIPAPGIGDASRRSWPDTIQQLFGPQSAGQVQRAPSTGLAQARSSFAAAFEPGGDATHGGAITEQARAGVAGSGQQVPHLAAIQRSFGSHDISGVRAHVGGKTADAADAMGAEAYAHGNDVAFRQSPDLHTAAHEAAHVVQQQAGIQLKGGLGQSGDGHERHADAVADRVVRGESAQSLLDQYASGGATTRGGAAGVQYLFQTMTTALEAASHDRGGARGPTRSTWRSCSCSTRVSSSSRSRRLRSRSWARCSA